MGGRREQLRSAYDSAFAGDLEPLDKFVDENETMPIRLRDMHELVLRLVFEINGKNRERNTKIAAHELRLAGLEARPLPKYCGTWDGLEKYLR